MVTCFTETTTPSAVMSANASYDITLGGSNGARGNGYWRFSDAAVSRLRPLPAPPAMPTATSDDVRHDLAGVAPGGGNGEPKDRRIDSRHPRRPGGREPRGSASGW